MTENSEELPKLEKGLTFKHARTCIRIKIVALPPIAIYGHKAEVVTLTDDGREIRPRPLDIAQLYPTPLTATGARRRDGYILETTA
ncbi:hypothetical protein ACIQCG_01060 [Streptomyces noursei]|uniref:hypothetical protein n=1 Tax=Streptomyces noursei TaxID=1971 RepID=UPI0037FA8533